MTADRGRTSARALLQSPDLTAEFEREVARCRRYGGSVSLSLIEVDTGNSERDLEDLSAVIAETLREWDSVWSDERTLLVLLPQTDATGAQRVVERIVEIASTADHEATGRSITFPDDAPTVEGLLAILKDRSERLGAR